MDTIRSRKMVRLGDTICFELDDNTIRCEKIDDGDSPSDTMADELNSLIHARPATADEEARVSPPPKSGFQQDVTTTVDLIMEDKASTNEEDVDELQKTIDDWLNKHWPKSDEFDRSDLTSLFQDSLVQDEYVRQITTDNRYAEVVEKLWRLAKETVTTNTGIEGEDDEEYLRIFTPQEKELLKTLASNLIAVSAKGRRGKIDSVSDGEDGQAAPVGP